MYKARLTIGNTRSSDVEDYRQIFLNVVSSTLGITQQEVEFIVEPGVDRGRPVVTAEVATDIDSDKVAALRRRIDLLDVNGTVTVTDLKAQD